MNYPDPYKRINGKLPYGYRRLKSSGKIVRHTLQQHVIAQASEMRSRGIPWAQIMRELNPDAVVTTLMRAVRREYGITSGTSSGPDRTDVIGAALEILTIAREIPDDWPRMPAGRGVYHARAERLANGEWIVSTESSRDPFGPLQIITAQGSPDEWIAAALRVWRSEPLIETMAREARVVVPLAFRKLLAQEETK